MARKRKGRDIQGVLLLDKPQGMTSNDVLQKVKRIFNAQKAGHTGALDPLATGMLPICFGESTKFSQYLLDSDKRYRVIARLGQRTDTSDADGQIIEERAITINLTDIQQALGHFIGDIMQIPTMFSALKHQGRPLYEYAREGITIEREARPITVYENRFIRFDNNELELEIHCSKGTYIRTIIDDLGEVLGCGAHVIYLRRLQVSNYPADKMVPLSYLQDHLENIDHLESFLMPIDSPVQDYPKIVLTTEQGRDILLGRSLTISNYDNSCLLTNLVRIYQQEQFIGVGELNNMILSPKRLIQTES
ncbi:tRNA pseudouridine(55) synthase TruB [Orbus mooreae]|uniref:tRNA pseudouridine(55) synthase TruB n=1 Tax=Orbus mooreae TaxID=3074107 RepID=UPI00370DD052